MAEITFGEAEGKFATAAAWVGGKKPTEKDTAVFAATSGNCNVEANAICQAIKATAYKKTLKITVGIELKIGDAVGGTSNAEAFALKWGTEAKWGGEGLLRFNTASTTVQKVFTAGVKPLATTVKFGATEVTTGKWQLEETLDVGANVIEVFGGELKTNGQEVKAREFSSESTTARTITLGASVLKLAGWNFALTTGLTFSGGSSTIELNEGFKGGGLTYGTLTLTGTQNVTGSNTIATLNLNGAEAKFEEGTTQTLTTLATTAKSGAEKTIKSSKAGTAAKFTKASGNVEVDWLKITDVETNNAVSWYAGANSTLSGLTNFWKKESPGGVTQVAAKMVLTLGTKLPMTHTQSVSSRSVLTVSQNTAILQGQQVAAKSLLTLGAKAQTSHLQEVSAKAKITLGAKLAPTHIQQAAMKAVITLRMKLNLTLVGARKFISGFMVWFEDDD